MITDTTWTRLRRMVQARDEETCVWCGKKVPEGHLDHILPISKGGTDSLDNLVWSCAACNLERNNKTLREWVKCLLDRNADTTQEKAEQSIETPGRTSGAVICCRTRKEYRRMSKLYPDATCLLTLPDYRASGWDCDCGGHFYLGVWGRIIYVQYPEGINHGHHHPNCILLKYYKRYGKWGSPPCWPPTHYLRNGVVCVRWDQNGWGYSRGSQVLPLRDGDEYYDTTFRVDEVFPRHTYIPTIGQYMQLHQEKWECLISQVEARGDF